MILIAVAVVLAVALAVTLFRSVLGSFEKPSDHYVVKSVLGLTVEEAQEKDGIKDIFTITVAQESVFSDYPAGTIAKQEPEDGDVCKGEKTAITVWLSAGKDVGKMIDVVTTPHTLAQAKVKLKALEEKYDLILEEPTEESRVFHDEVEEILHPRPGCRAVVQGHVVPAVGGRVIHNTASCIDALRNEVGAVAADSSEVAEYGVLRKRVLFRILNRSFSLVLLCY